VRAAAWLPEGSVAVGITAGASTPDSVVGDVVEKIIALRGHTASELTGPSAYEEGSSSGA